MRPICAPLPLRTALLILVTLWVAACGILGHGLYAAPQDAPPAISAPQETAPSEADCRVAAAEIGRTQDYSGGALEKACFGEEDDSRVGLALDYGMTESQYAEAEQAEMTDVGA